MAKQNKVLWGSAKMGWAPITAGPDGKDTYGAIKMFEGTRQINWTASGNQTQVYADGTVIFVGNQNSGYMGTLEFTILDEAFAQYALGEKASDKKVIYEENEANPGRFVLVWEWVQDAKNARHVMYNCTANRPDVSATTAGDGGSKTPQYRTLNVTAIPRADGVVKARTYEETDETVYDGWFTAVHDPKAA